MRRFLLMLFALVAILLLPAQAVSAHPLGNFTVNAAAHLIVSQSDVVIEYAVDLAEIPTFQLQEEINRGNGNAATGAIESLYGPALQESLVLEADGSRLMLTLEDIQARFEPGQAALEVTRVDASFSASLPSEEMRLTFEDRNFLDRVGWREVTLATISGRGVLDSSVPEESISRGLRAYPDDLLSSPPRVTGAAATVDPAAAGIAPAVGMSTEGDASPAEELFGGSFASLIERDLSPGVILGAIILAMGFGALHALGPGHGKTVMAAYLVGAEGRARQAVIVGIAVSLMHTTSVVVLGLITLGASSVFAPESVYPWLSFISGVVVVALGGWLLRARLRTRKSSTAHVSAAHHNDHDHEHNGNHEGSPVTEHARAHALGLDHSHGALPEGGRLLSRKGLGAIAISGGLLPSPTALVVLLGAVALHRVAFGIALVAAFSVGLAAALTIVGLLVLRARDVIQRRGRGRLANILPVMSAGAILMLGTILTTQAIVNLPL